MKQDNNVWYTDGTEVQTTSNTYLRLVKYIGNLMLH